VFDAATMAAEPVASVALPRIPFGFHGSWVPATVAN
jgi:carotenoid cleavage dioxygenase